MLTSPVAPTTFANLTWPQGGSDIVNIARGTALAFAGACLLTAAAKVQVPGPVPTTLQTLAVLALGALLGARLALAAVAIYVVEGFFGLPVFANTPPQAAGPAYLLGPTGGYLMGFAAAAVLIGGAADRGLVRRPLAFGLALAAGLAALLASGWLWLAVAVPGPGGTGLGARRAFELGVAPFLVGETLKLGLAAILLPVAYRVLQRRSSP